MTSKLLVTSALPYANGPLHLGHMVEHIQTDVWVRWQKLLGRSCIAVCGADAHGTPIMIKAEQLGITPEALVSEMQAQHASTFQHFHIHYDNYYTTHSAENKALSQLIYERLKKNGDITRKTIRQAFDPEKNIFLPDRYVKGECPACHTADQYGDSCEQCGATYSPLELLNPYSVLSGKTPIEKESEHLFFDLPRYTEMLREWTHAGHLQQEITNKLDEWLDNGLQTWDISRDAPYFGFEIPGEKDKYFYVWLDAPIGYMASFQHYCEQQANIKFEEYWSENSPTELYHFVGKDIIYFHALFWPAMLKGANFRTPTAIFAHGFLTVNGQKMSKSRGTFIQASAYLDYLNPEYLRYYFAAKLSNKIDDIDLNFEDFVQRVNADLVGKVVNIASRCASFIHKYADNQLANTLDQPELYQHFVQKGNEIADLFLAREYSRGVRDIMELADKANQYIDSEKPWVMAKDPQQLPRVQVVCTLGLNLFRLLMLYLSPILPETAQKSAEFLNLPPQGSLEAWQQREKPLLSHTIQPFQALMQRIQPETVKALQEAAKISAIEKA